MLELLLFLFNLVLQVLFELARFHAPSTIFMDELDAIMGQRSGFGAPGSVGQVIISIYSM